MRLFILTFLTVLIYVRCANIVPPTGGPRDTKAPKVKTVIPTNGTTNFKKNYILVSYDELIDDNQLASKVIVSPTITGIYKVRIKKNLVRLEWADTLKENTTYTFNFSNGIKDLTESNQTENLAITFSTGPDIDSNKVESLVQPLPGQKIESNTKVLLFPVLDSIQKYQRLKPEYIGNVAANGSVSIPYIKEGNYTILSIIDYNKNNFWNFNEPLDIHKNVHIKEILNDTFNIQPSTLDTAKVASTNNTDKNLKIQFSKGLQEINVLDFNGNYLVSQLTNREYSIENQYHLADSTLIQIKFVDSSGINSVYTKKIKFKTPDSKRDKDTLIYIDDIHKRTNLKPRLDSIQLRTNKFVDSMPFIISAPEYVTYRMINNYTKLSIVLKGQKEGDSIIISTPAKSMRSIYGETNQVFKRKFIVAQEKEFGNLSFSIQSKQKEFVITLSDSKGSIVYRNENSSIHHLKNLEPGEYVLKAFIDINKNGVFDAYDPINEIPAEPIYYYKEKILIKANWDIEDIQMIF